MRFNFGFFLLCSVHGHDEQDDGLAAVEEARVQLDQVQLVVGLEEVEMPLARQKKVVRVHEEVQALSLIALAQLDIYTTVEISL